MHQSISLSVCLFIRRSIDQSIKELTWPNLRWSFYRTRIDGLCNPGVISITMTSSTKTTMMMTKSLVLRERLLFRENDGVCQTIRRRWKLPIKLFWDKVTVRRITKWMYSDARWCKLVRGTISNERCFVRKWLFLRSGHETVKPVTDDILYGSYYWDAMSVVLFFSSR